MEPNPSNHNEEAAERFSNGVANLMMATEELRQTLSQEEVTIHLLIQWQHEIESILGSLDSLARWTQDAVAAVEEDMFRHCRSKALAVAQQVLEAAFSFVEPDLDDEVPLDMPPIPEQRRDAQGAIARITELNLLLYHQSPEGQQLKSAEEMVEEYASYQRSVLRLRARPAIAELVQARRDGRIVVPDSLPGTHKVNGNGVDEDEESAPGMQQFHAPVLTVVLGDAAALIHPLLEWKMSLPPPQQGEPPIVTNIRQLCRESISKLNEQAQTLLKTVSDWFWEDRPIDEWMQKSAQAEESAAQSASDRQRDLAVLDSFVEEMAFSCQVQARYQSFMLSQSVEQDGVTVQESVIGKELLPEWTWKYAALERLLAMQQWQSALELAAPVHIVLGEAVQVPSVVEDAQYLSTRALERAASTRSLQAIGTVAHAVSHDVWSVMEGLGVHQALIDRRGCWSEPQQEENNKNPDESAKREEKNVFASALLDALDDDLGPSDNPADSPGKAPTSVPRRAPNSSSIPPSSGGFLSSIVGGGGFNDAMRQMQLDTLFCFLNGIHAAACACGSLVAFLDTLLVLSPNDQEAFEALPAADNKKATSMIQLAREELFRYSEGYKKMLSEEIADACPTWCGSGKRESAFKSQTEALNSLRFFLEHEEYNIASAAFSEAEADERLDRDMIGPMQNSLWFQHMSSKCDSEVKRLVGVFLATTITGMVIECLWESGKQVSDFGALLLSKQVRSLQNFVAKAVASSDDDISIVAAPGLLGIWERLLQVIAVLQLEKPSDWLLYYSTSNLTPDELYKTMELRIDFPREAIKSVVSQIRQQLEQLHSNK